MSPYLNCDITLHKRQYKVVPKPHLWTNTHALNVTRNYRHTKKTRFDTVGRCKKKELFTNNKKCVRTFFRNSKHGCQFLSTSHRHFSLYSVLEVEIYGRHCKKNAQSVCNESTEVLRHCTKSPITALQSEDNFPRLADHVSTLCHLVSVFPGHGNVNNKTKENKNIWVASKCRPSWHKKSSLFASLILILKRVIYC